MAKKTGEKETVEKAKGFEILSMRNQPAAVAPIPSTGAN